MFARRLSLLLLSSLALSLSACGFTPMYGANSAARGLENISVETGEERIDFLLQEALLDTLGARGAGGSYVLRTETELSTVGLGIGADAIASRFAVQLRVNYSLYRPGVSEAVFSGRVSTEASYNASNAVYASQSAQSNAEERAASDAADRIAMQLARAARNGELW